MDMETCNRRGYAEGKGEKKKEKGETSYLCATTFCVIKEVDCSTSVVAFSMASNNLAAKTNTQ